MIRVKDISNNWGEFELKNVSLEVKQGEYFVILGPTGSGKTLLLELIVGLYIPNKGKIFIEGKDITYEVPEKRNLGFLYQDYSLFPHFSVRKNIEYGMKLRNMSKTEIDNKLKELSKMFKIQNLMHRDVTTLSGGEQQRVALARALATNPKVLLLDEPFSALDENTKANLISEMKELHRKEGITFIHVTHSQEEAMILADRIGIIMNGTIVQVGTPEEIFYKPKTKEIARFVKIENIWEGKVIEKRNEEIVIEIKGKKIVAISNHFKVGDEVRLIIRPEDVVIGKGNTSARNVFKGVVSDVIKHGFYNIVRIDCGFQVEAAVTKQSIENLNIKEGKNINIFFKATSIQVIKK
ncbi:MAG: Trehalose/maltose import ATP-binding protein MalK [Euryarchaeota archaeon ADurb.Bin023]|jgi:molybdate/tungstate transport system ATP-binding protein|nr:ABC transporter ATP-binding protein [Methanofastidiosum sp.]OQC49756.1 MAG: Trehalose/maltose import ATP-binding protein MalK [Euryarchaeota archaeon ADurb.Bin023]HNV93691.1 ABC transporter ATP-binding protein [Methanofastidiosum sp.]HNZ60988.1 ABC transporter ATP-binding protein [Methanofastidiosum sp.]HOT84526.1 ABC transporter ATP-binding protein [Methanofastidiosum sp.]